MRFEAEGLRSVGILVPDEVCSLIKFNSKARCANSSNGSIQNADLLLLCGWLQVIDTVKHHIRQGLSAMSAPVRGKRRRLGALDPPKTEFTTGGQKKAPNTRASIKEAEGRELNSQTEVPQNLLALSSSGIFDYNPDTESTLAVHQGNFKKNLALASQQPETNVPSSPGYGAIPEKQPAIRKRGRPTKAAMIQSYSQVESQHTAKKNSQTSAEMQQQKRVRRMPTPTAASSRPKRTTAGKTLSLDLSGERSIYNRAKPHPGVLGADVQDSTKFRLISAVKKPIVRKLPSRAQKVPQVLTADATRPRRKNLRALPLYWILTHQVPFPKKKTSLGVVPQLGAEGHR